MWSVTNYIGLLPSTAYFYEFMINNYHFTYIVHEIWGVFINSQINYWNGGMTLKACIQIIHIII